jgi:ArsR family transcriptional regulator
MVLVFKALGDENRLKIISMLGEFEVCACRLIEGLNITQPTLSHHMKILCKCGLVNATKKGIWMYYSLNREKFNELIAFFEEVNANKNRGDKCCEDC